MTAILNILAGLLKAIILLLNPIFPRDKYLDQYWWHWAFYFIILFSSTTTLLIIVVDLKAMGISTSDISLDTYSELIQYYFKYNLINALQAIFLGIIIPAAFYRLFLAAWGIGKKPL